MSEMLHCATHGEQKVTLVCKHIPAAMKTGEAAGFYWSNEGGEYDAICEECNELSDKEWQAQQEELVTAICLGCFTAAALANGVEMEGIA